MTTNKLPLTLPEDGKITREVIQSIHDFMAPFLKEDDSLTIICSRDVCSEPKSIADVEWKNLFDSTIVEGTVIDYQYGTIRGTFPHDIMLVISRLLPEKTCYVMRMPHDTEPIMYKHYPYSKIVEPDMTKPPELPAIHD